MKTTRNFRTLACSLLGAALTSVSAFAISPSDLSALRAKAETGDGIAQHNLGLVYANSQELISDLVEAYAWLNLAADNGATGRSLMIVSRQMTPEQITAGKIRFDQIREAIATKKPIPPGAVARAASPITPVSGGSGSPVSPVSPVQPVIVDTAAEQAELKKISAELAAAWKENDQLKTAVAQAEKAAAASVVNLKQEQAELSSSLENATREIAGMKAAAANFEGERNGLLQKIAEAQRASDGELRLKLVAAENEVAKARAVAKELEAAKQSLASLGEQQQKLSAENQRLTGVAQKSDAAEKRATEMDKALGALRTELSAAKAQQSEAAKKIADGEKVTGDLAAAQKRIKTLEAAAGKFDAEKKELLTKLDGAVSPGEVARTNSQLAELKERASASQQALALANADVASLKQELQDSKRGVVPVQQHRELQAKLESRAAEQQKQAETELKKVKDAAEAEKARLSADLAAATKAATQEVGALKAGAANSEGERNGLLKKIADVEKSLAAANADSAALKRQLETAKNDAVPAAKVKELEAKLSAATKAQEEQQKARGDLQKTVASLEEEKAALGEKLSALAEASTKEAATLKAGAANFEGERNGLLRKIAESEQGLARALAEAGTIREQLNAAQASSGEATRISADLVRTTQELEELKANGAGALKALANVQAEADALKLQLAEVKAGSVSAQEHKELQAKLDSVMKSQEQQQGSQSELQKAIASLEAEKTSLAEKFAAQSSAATAEVAALRAAAANFEGERNGLAQKISSAEQALAQAAAEADSLKEKLAAAAKSGDAPAKEVQDLQAKLAAATSEQEAQEKQQAALRQTQATLEAEAARLSRELAEAKNVAGDAVQAKTALAELQSRVNTADEAVAAARADRDALAKRVAELEQEKTASPATASGEDPAELRKQLDDASNKLATTLRSFELNQAEIDRLQKSLVSTDNERAALAERIFTAEKQAAEARAASATGAEASAQLSSMREQLRNAQNQMGQLAAENIQLKNRSAMAQVVATAPVLSSPRRPADTSSPTSSIVRANQAAESRVHTVVEGENLTRIARRYYGNSERWVEIYDANRTSLPNPASLKIGMKLRIP